MARVYPSKDTKVGPRSPQEDEQQLLLWRHWQVTLDADSATTVHQILSPSEHSCGGKRQHTSLPHIPRAEGA